MDPSSCVVGDRAEPAVVPSAGRQGLLELPARAEGVVMVAARGGFGHDGGSGRRLGPHARRVAEALRRAGFATLRFDPLTETETTDWRKAFDGVGLLARRIEGAVDLIARHPATAGLPVGLFGTGSAGAAAALVTAAGRPGIVGGDDRGLPELNAWARSRMACPTELAMVPGATCLLAGAAEPGPAGAPAEEAIARLATDWFRHRLVAATPPGASHVPA